MFSEAVQTASHFTFPYVGLRRRTDGTVYSVVAAFVVINEDGWIATSAHIIGELMSSRQEADKTAAEGPDADAVRVQNVSEIWALPGFARSKPVLVNGRVNGAADIAIGRLEPFDPALIEHYPLLRDADADPILQGMSVCRLGFPFHDVPAEFDTAENQFRLPEHAFPVPRFALDGIVARFNRRNGADGSSALFIETSTPGLRGQSGGPLLDRDGRVCGIQSQTAHVDLGFDARYATAGGEQITERQFLNVGVATHVDEVCELLDAEGVSYRRG